MKKIKFIPTLLCLFSILLITSCEKEDLSPTNGSSTTSGSSQMQGTWARNDGQASTYLKIDGTVAITCNNGTATTGTFNSAVPSVTFVVSGSTYVFKMSMQDDKLILGVPNNSTNPNHVPTEYIKSSTWPCGSSGKKIAVGLNPNDNDLIGMTISYVMIENIYIPMQLLNSGVTSPDCSSPTGYINTPASSNGIGYYINVKYSFEGFLGTEYATDITSIHNSQLGAECNKFKVGRNGIGLIGLIPM